METSLVKEVQKLLEEKTALLENIGYQIDDIRDMIDEIDDIITEKSEPENDISDGDEMLDKLESEINLLKITLDNTKHISGVATSILFHL